jgi:hypothetical protein
MFGELYTILVTYMSTSLLEVKLYYNFRDQR